MIALIREALWAHRTLRRAVRGLLGGLASAEPWEAQDACWEALR